MQRIKVYLGSSQVDKQVQQLLEGWSGEHPQLLLDYVSIHVNPAAAVRLGITRLPALVIEDKLVVQGLRAEELLPRLNRMFD